MISALTWIRKNAAKEFPVKLDLSSEEFERIANEIGANIKDIKLEMIENELVQDDDDSTMPVDNSDNPMAKYNMDSYDHEKGNSIPFFGNTAGISYHSTDDPYIQIDAETQIDEIERSEMQILPTDNLLIACKTDEDISHLEIYVYEHDQDNLYVHHDIMLPSFPLCVEWLDYQQNSNEKGNFVAVGTFEPQVEIWDLDTSDAIYPTIILGKSAKEPTTRKKRQLSQKPNDSCHVSAITSISWNKTHSNLILTASTDSTIKLWDLSSDCSIPIKSYNHHSDKVTVVLWNTLEPTIFVSGGYDNGGTVFVLDSRAPDNLLKWDIGSDVECIKWDPFRAERFYVTSEDGMVRCFDVNSPNVLVFMINAHDGAVSALDVNGLVDGLLVTGGADKTTKVWDTRDITKISCIVSRDLSVGKVFAASFCVDVPLVVSVTGSKGKIVVWNLENNAGVRKIFGDGSAVDVEARKELVEIEESDQEMSEDEIVEEEEEEE